MAQNDLHTSVWQPLEKTLCGTNACKEFPRPKTLQKPHPTNQTHVYQFTTTISLTFIAAFASQIQPGSRGWNNGSSKIDLIPPQMSSPSRKQDFTGNCFPFIWDFNCLLYYLANPTFLLFKPIEESLSPSSLPSLEFSRAHFFGDEKTLFWIRFVVACATMTIVGFVVWGCVLITLNWKQLRRCEVLVKMYLANRIPKNNFIDHNNTTI